MTTASAVQTVIASTAGALLMPILPHRAVDLAVALLLTLGGHAGWTAFTWTFALCSLLMAGRNPGHFGESLSPRGKWVLGAIGVALLAVLAGVVVWSTVNQGSYNRSQDGCINVTVVSSTGAGTIHACGGKARALCQNAFRHNDKLSRLTRTQCRLARLGASQQP